MTQPGWRPRRREMLATMLVGVAVLPACAASGPATATEVCDAYQELAEEMGNANGLFDNAIFNRAEDLGEVAVRYEANDSIVADGEALKAIGDSDSTSDVALDRASSAISALCGQQSLSGYSARLRFGFD